MFVADGHQAAADPSPTPVELLSRIWRRMSRIWSASHSSFSSMTVHNMTSRHNPAECQLEVPRECHRCPECRSCPRGGRDAAGLLAGPALTRTGAAERPLHRTREMGTGSASPRTRRRRRALQCGHGRTAPVSGALLIEGLQPNPNRSTTRAAASQSGSVIVLVVTSQDSAAVFSDS